MGTKIDKLSAKDTPAAGDQVVLYSTSDGDARRASVTALAATIQSLITVNDDKTTQYDAPSASPFTTTVTQSSSSIWLILTPTGTLAVGTIALPASGTAADRQEVLINCTQAVTTLTVSATGANVTGAPSTLAANDRFLMRYDAPSNTWYRVG
jgi:hypothetical protein